MRSDSIRFSFSFSFTSFPKEEEWDIYYYYYYYFNSMRGTIHASGMSMNDDSRHATPSISKGAIDGQEPFKFISDNEHKQSVVIGLPQTDFEYILEWQCARPT